MQQRATLAANAFWDKAAVTVPKLSGTAVELSTEVDECVVATVDTDKVVVVLSLDIVVSREALLLELASFVLVGYSLPTVLLTVTKIPGGLDS